MRKPNRACRRLFFFCPEIARPLGGTRVLYRHVDLLRRAGFDARALHMTPGFRYRWFENDTPVALASKIRWRKSDILVVPELLAVRLFRAFPVPAKVIYNQNCYLTFEADLAVTSSSAYSPYRDPRHVATVTVSRDSADYLRYVFPSLQLLQITPSIDPSLFFPGTRKKRQIAFMPRKNFADVLQVINILKQRRALNGYELKPIEGKAPEYVAHVLRDSRFFFSFGAPEGLGLPPLEAMASGAVVIGYHGDTRRELPRRDGRRPSLRARSGAHAPVGRRAARGGEGHGTPWPGARGTALFTRRRARERDRGVGADYLPSPGSRFGRRERRQGAAGAGSARRSRRRRSAS